MPASSHADDSFEALLLPAWTALAVDASQLGAAAADLRQARDRVAAAQRGRLDAFATMFEARWQLALGELATARAQNEQALRLARDAGTADAADAEAACVDLRAFIAIAEGRHDDARRDVEPWLLRIERMPEPLPTTWAIVRYLMLTRRTLVLERSGRHDDALGPSYAYLAAARACGQTPYLARALATVGGLHASLSNFEDAWELCSEAWALCEPQGWIGCMSAAGPNLMIALWGLGRADEASAMAHTLLALEPRMAPGQRNQRHFMCAIALAAAGEHGLAQECLDRGMAAQTPGTPARCEWVWTQANLWIHAGRPREALQSVVEQLARDDVVISRFPVDLIELHRAAARSCEALGEFRQALDHERKASSAREQANRTAAQARQRSLQIRHELATARLQRDQALSEQQRLAALNAQLREAGEAKTRFLAAASHDLRQPLHALTLQAAALQPHVQGAQARHLLGGVQRCAASLAAMFEALLDLARADTGTLVPQRQALNIAMLLADLVDEHRDQAAAKGLRLAFRAAPRDAMGYGCDSDPQLLTALLRNLLVNAVRYTDQGTVLLCLRRVPGTAGSWRVQVRDSGIGIAPEHQARVFEEFYQVGNAERRREQGLGLGLAIAQRLARLLEHPIALRSAPGRGTCLELRLPRAHNPATVRDLATPTPHFDGLRVAVLEDEPEVAQALVGLLRQWGCEVEHFEHAQALLRHYEHDSPPQALLADHRLPGGISGAEAILRLRAQCGRQVPAVILTGDVAPNTMAGFQAAQLECLPKPVPIPGLALWLAAVAAHVAAHAAAHVAAHAEGAGHASHRRELGGVTSAALASGAPSG